MNTTPNILSPRVQAGIVVALLLMFAGVLFLPAFRETFKVEADVKQTLFSLVTAVVFFFIGKNTDTASRDAVITAAAIAPYLPTVPAVPVKVDSTTPIAVAVVDEPKPKPLMA
jgi:hypothetical protein